MKNYNGLKSFLGIGFIAGSTVASPLYANTNTNNTPTIEQTILKQANEIVDQTNANWYVIGHNYIEYRQDKKQKPLITVYEKDKDKDISISGKGFSLDVDIGNGKTNILMRTDRNCDHKRIRTSDIKNLKPYLKLHEKTMRGFGKGTPNARKRYNPYPGEK